MCLTASGIGNVEITLADSGYDVKSLHERKSLGYFVGRVGIAKVNFRARKN